MGKKEWKETSLPGMYSFIKVMSFDLKFSTDHWSVKRWLEFPEFSFDC